MATPLARVLIAGLGNELLSDDGAGVHACRLLQEEPRTFATADVVVAEVVTAVMDALHLLEWAELIVAIDAMQGQGPPGSLYVATPDELAEEQPLGLHQLSLLGALQMVEEEMRGRARDSAPEEPGAPDWLKPEIEILGVEPAHLGLGTTLSPEVAAVLPALAAHAWQRVERWLARGAAWRPPPP